MIAVGMRVYWRRHGTPESLYQQDQDFGKERESVCVREREQKKGAIREGGSESRRAGSDTSSTLT